MNQAEVLTELAKILEQRKQADPTDSYVASLYAGGVDLITTKISEEAEETINAAKNEGNKQLIHETADLWFHSLVLLCHMNLTPEEVLTELSRRFGTSGHEEKASRNK